MDATQAGLNNFFSMPTPTDAGGLLESWYVRNKRRLNFSV